MSSRHSGAMVPHFQLFADVPEGADFSTDRSSWRMRLFHALKLTMPVPAISAKLEAPAVYTLSLYEANSSTVGCLTKLHSRYAGSPLHDTNTFLTIRICCTLDVGVVS